MESMICRYCSKPIKFSGEATTTNGYWSGTQFDCHKVCKVEGRLQEALDCQMIDADCNDCRHFKRGQRVPDTISKLHTEDGRIVDVIYKPDIFRGHCLKFDKPTLAFPNKWTGHECFEHRRG